MDAWEGGGVAGGQGRREEQEQEQEQGAGGVAERRGTFLADALELSKPRIVVMVLITAVATAVVGGGATLFGVLDWVALLVGTALVAGAAGAANQIWERGIDRNMARTANRPLADGRLSVGLAVAGTTAALIVGSAVLWAAFGATPAVVGWATFGSYVFVYTPMKVRTAWNTTVGAVAGALPMLIGYTAAGGTWTDVPGWLLVLISVAWQYPHFMAIAWMYRRQYDQAGFVMTTTVEPTGRDAAFQAIAGSVAVVLTAVALLAWTAAAWYAVVGSVLILAATWPMLRASVAFRGERDDASARRLLRSSLWVLPVVLLLATVGVFT